MTDQSYVIVAAVRPTSDYWIMMWGYTEIHPTVEVAVEQNRLHRVGHTQRFRRK